jgi:heme/copper-type cytochrome/quinol oxidase subunit 4
MIAAKVVDWATLGKVVAAAFAAGVVVAIGFSCAILGVVRSAEMRRAGRGLEASGFVVVGLFGAAVCAALVVGSIIVMTAK